jgi:transcriptional regulator with XRE-family HTH domain
MEHRTGTPIEKWDEVNGNASFKSQDMAPANDFSQGERFVQLREQTGMNRKDFAEYLGIPYRTMQDWERDVRTMPSYVFALIEYKVRNEFGKKLPQELDPNTIGNVRRGLEDQVEQNDNNLDGIINNVANVIDDNANGIPDEDEKIYASQAAQEKVSAPKVTVHEKEEKTSLLKMLHDCKPEAPDKPYRQLAPELVL